MNTYIVRFYSRGADAMGTEVRVTAASAADALTAAEAMLEVSIRVHTTSGDVALTPDTCRCCVRLRPCGCSCHDV